MSKFGFSLPEHHWLFLLVFILITLAGNIIFTILLAYPLKLPRASPLFDFWVNVLNNTTIVFLLVPFVLGFPGRSRSYTAYLTEIRLTQWQPALKLLLLGISCWLIIAFCQFASTLIFRLSHGGAVNLAFLRGAFPLQAEFPPNSSGWLVSMISITEELAFRGVILAVFLRHYDPTRAVLFSALSFGAVHIFNIIGGKPPVWAAGNVVWASLLGLFYGYVTIKTGSLLPAMLVHYLSNLFIYPLTEYIQIHASTPVQTLYGVTLTMGAVPVALMLLWVRFSTSTWFMPPTNITG
jgi:membrane protease YdiL (CAAX protease family)